MRWGVAWVRFFNALFILKSNAEERQRGHDESTGGVVVQEIQRHKSGDRPELDELGEMSGYNAATLKRPLY